jgi:hypothetical protein
MKNLRHLSSVILLYLLGSALLESCTSESGPDPVDCNTNPVAIQSISSSEATCGLSDGSLVITADGGTGEFMYSINGTDFQPSNSFQNLDAGNYTVTVMDNNECSASGSAIIESSSGLMITTELTSESGCDSSNGALLVDVTGGTGPYQYKLNDEPFQDNADFSGLEAGTYDVMARDVNGCEISSTVEVTRGTSLEDEVMPILMANCAISGCHDGNNNLADWSDIGSVLANASNIKTRTGNGTMPPGDDTLTNEEILAIACWVDDGAPNN